MDTSDRIAYLGELLSRCHRLYLWQIEAGQMQLTTGQAEAELTALLPLSEIVDTCHTFFRDHEKPLILTDSAGLMWICAGTWLLGPFLMDDSLMQEARHHLHRMHLSSSLREKATDLLAQMPIIAFSKVNEYAMMLYYTLTGEVISISDLHFREAASGSSGTANDTSAPADLHGTYEAEREMLRMVREGDTVHICEQISRISLSGRLGNLSGRHPNRQFKNSILVNIVLFSRAAIEGGLSPELAMSLTDTYFQEVEAAKSISELSEIASTMQMDFVERVRKIRMDTGYAPAVRQSIGYIELHLEEPISLKDLGYTLGYDPYYLGKVFSRETGQSFRRYLLHERLERARYLLKNPELSIGEISDRLQFSSQSYFTEQFRRAYEMTPGEYKREI